jgi:hypothetical protein
VILNHGGIIPYGSLSEIFAKVEIYKRKSVSDSWHRHCEFARSLLKFDIKASLLILYSGCEEDNVLRMKRMVWMMSKDTSNDYSYFSVASAGIFIEGGL